MGEELSTGIRIGITMVIIVMILVTILILVTLGRAFGNVYVQDVQSKSSPNYEATLREVSQQVDPVPIPSIYAALLYLDESDVTQFTVHFQPETARNYHKFDTANYFDVGMDDIKSYSDKQGYLRVVQASDGLHVWVGNYQITSEGWVVVH